MGILLKTVIRLKGGSIKRSFDRSTEHPQAVQDNLLLEILRNRRDTDYGRRHGFSRVTGTEAFTKSVPINDFSNLALYVERMKRGERDVLVPGQPLMFNVTSGTTDKPKYIPVTRRGLSLTSEISNQWLYRVLQDHPTCLDQAFLCVTGSSLEGRTVAGIPYGSASGLIYRNLPRALRPSLVLPFAVSDIKSYDLRYYLMTRLALEKEVSCATTPNPTTLMKLAETATDYQEEIVRSINDGVLFRKLPFDVNHDDAGILDILGVSQRPNRSRAQSLEAIISRHGHLVPSEYWKELKLIGCWLGGSVGFQVDKLSALLGQKVPMRDIGFRASEGSLTVPCEDNTSAGILALDNAYYEFVPAAENTSEDTRTLRSHELEDGKQYKIIITNWDGLYRYDIHDIVEVQGFHNQTPIIAFVRKSEDMLNITGEKVHVNHFLKAFECLKGEHDVSVTQFRVVPDYDALRYEILIHIAPLPSAEVLRNTILPFIDRVLCEANVEYNGKRASGRLNLPCLHIMGSDWEESVREESVETGNRDIQYKWRMLAEKMSDLDSAHIKSTISMQGGKE